MPQTAAAIRSYRIYFRDTMSALSPAHEVNLGSDEDARELAALMVDERPTYPCAEVWDRGRLVCIVRCGE
jgi:hypothetical protein